MLCNDYDCSYRSILLPPCFLGWSTIRGIGIKLLYGEHPFMREAIWRVEKKTRYVDMDFVCLSFSTSWSAQPILKALDFWVF